MAKEKTILKNGELDLHQILKLKGFFLHFKKKSQALAELEQKGAEIYAVGGGVRDVLLGRKPHDLDWVIRFLNMSEILETLKKYGKAEVFGKSFSTLKFWPEGAEKAVWGEFIELDFALPRLEKSNGFGHQDFEIQADPFLAIEADLGRRDFSCNAIAFSLKNENFLDPLSGIESLKKQSLELCFPGSFQDDPLRIYRAYKFACRLHFSFSDDLRDQLHLSIDAVKYLSQERIYQEIRQIFLKSSWSPLLGEFLLNHKLFSKIVLDGEFPMGVEAQAQAILQKIEEKSALAEFEDIWNNSPLQAGLEFEQRLLLWIFWAQKQGIFAAKNKVQAPLQRAFVFPQKSFHHLDFVWRNWLELLDQSKLSQHAQLFFEFCQKEFTLEEQEFWQLLWRQNNCLHLVEKEALLQPVYWTAYEKASRNLNSELAVFKNSEFFVLRNTHRLQAKKNLPPNPQIISLWNLAPSEKKHLTWLLDCNFLLFYGMCFKNRNYQALLSIPRERAAGLEIPTHPQSESFQELSLRWFRYWRDKHAATGA